MLARLGRSPDAARRASRARRRTRGRSATGSRADIRHSRDRDRRSGGCATARNADRGRSYIRAASRRSRRRHKRDRTTRRRRGRSGGRRNRRRSPGRPRSDPRHSRSARVLQNGRRAAAAPSGCPSRRRSLDRRATGSRGPSLRRPAPRRASARGRACARRPARHKPCHSPSMRNRLVKRWRRRRRSGARGGPWRGFGEVTKFSGRHVPRTWLRGVGHREPENGGAEGNRTPDLCSAIAALSHLSYSPAPFGAPQIATGWARCNPARKLASEGPDVRSSRSHSRRHPGADARARRAARPNCWSPSGPGRWPSPPAPWSFPAAGSTPTTIAPPRCSEPTRRGSPRSARRSRKRGSRSA